MADQGNVSLLRSCRSNQIAYVKFVNTTKQDISLEWIDFRGHHVAYKPHLKQYHHFSIKTFVGHPWMAYDSNYRHTMVFSPDRSQVHFPTASRMSSGVPTQSVVSVLTPLVSLEKMCLQVLHRCIKDEHTLKDLPLYPVMKEKLIKLFLNQKNTDLPIRMVEIT